MPQTTFYDLWMSMRLYVPGAPVFLLQKWMKNVFRELVDRRMWSWQLSEGQLVWQDARDLAEVTVAFGSREVDSAALFVAADVGRNFRVGTYPIYTVVQMITPSRILLDRPYEGTGADGVITDNATILDAYVTLPPSFESFVAVLDPVNQRQIPWWATWQELDVIDPIRMAAESVPRLLAAATPSVLPATLGQTRYEYYPKPISHGALQYIAKAVPFSMGDTDPLPGLLQHRQDVVEAGMLAKAARWPGTADVKNPYFNLALAREQQAEFERLANQLDIRDDDVYQQSIDRYPWHRWNAWTWAYDTHLLQQTDAGLDAYVGMGTGLYL